jgi:hypothetical protein
MLVDQEMGNFDRGGSGLEIAQLTHTGEQLSVCLELLCNGLNQALSRGKKPLAGVQCLQK